MNGILGWFWDYAATCSLHTGSYWDIGVGWGGVFLGLGVLLCNTVQVMIYRKNRII